MNSAINHKVLQKLRGGYKKYIHQFNSSWVIQSDFDYSGQEASDLIKQKLLQNDPLMISRFGWNEIGITCAYKHMSSPGIAKYIQYIKGDIDIFWWDEKWFTNAFNCSGLFPLELKTLERFGRLMLQDMNQVDILGSWLKTEEDFKQDLRNAIKVPLRDLDPYYHETPWSEVLANKKVLVIHPFSESIKKQYEKRVLLFEDKRVLPLFELDTIKAVQSIAGAVTGFENWFEALEYMKQEIVKKKFDIAIIGCGAYGFSLAAFIKRLGKKAVHLGGSTQALFGIMGKRWEKNETAKYINQYWVRPSQAETPENALSVENGCYW